MNNLIQRNIRPSGIAFNADISSATSNTIKTPYGGSMELQEAHAKLTYYDSILTLVLCLLSTAIIIAALIGAYIITKVIVA